MSKTQRATLARVTRSLVTAAVVGLMLVWSAPASAQQKKCLAGKTKCMSKKASGLLKCEETAETPGKPTDTTACEAKVDGKFNGGLDLTKGCFEKLENAKNSDCITTDDTDAAEAAVDSCVAAFVAAIDGHGPPPTQSKCLVSKKKCVAKLLGSLLKCQATAQTPGKPTDPDAGGCQDKATAKYTGGMDLSKGCFAKLEAKDPTGCAPTCTSDTLQADVTDCVTSLVNLETATTTTTTLPIGPGIHGALTPTFGRFNYMAGIGLTGAQDQCMHDFPGTTHPCTYAELTAAPTSRLKLLKDTANGLVTSFWAIDASPDPLHNCVDDAPMTGSGLNWEYATAHTSSRGDKVPLDNASGMLGALDPGEICANLGTNAASVGCCQ